MNLSEISYISDNPNLVKKHAILMKLQENGCKVEAIYNKHTSRYDENLISVNDLLCFILPIDNSPRILSDVILTDTDFIIACSSNFNRTNYYIIPSDEIICKKGSYPLEYGMYKDCWELLKL